MATIQNPRLTLVNHDHDKRLATVRVDYTARLTAVERQLGGLRFRESIELWGADSPDPDDFLYRFTTTTFATASGGSVVRQREVTLADDILDEDGWLRPTDEVYAKIWIVPYNMPASGYARSNEIHHRF